ncbi:MAG: hypothetical protein U0414_33665 [Polyangiaceae bacterium]
MTGGGSFFAGFASRARSAARRARARVVEDRMGSASVGIAVLATVVTVAWPLLSTRYPPMIDLPMHAAHTSAFRHWFDPAYHFQDQFELQPFSVPYDASYVLGALFMLVMGVIPAVKLATAIMLLALPVGLGVLAWGMRKSPLSGLMGLPFVWCGLVHWGFINAASAIGQFALVIGLALRAVDRPTWRVQVALAVSLVVLFFTHVFRFPLGVAGVVAAAVVAWPATRRLRPALLPLVPSLALFAVFYVRRPAALAGGLGSMRVDTSHIRQLGRALVNGFEGMTEGIAAIVFVALLLVVQVAMAVDWLGARWRARRAARGAAPPAPKRARVLPDPQWFDERFTALVTLVPLGCAAVCFALFFTLPMMIGVWWYVFPREGVAAVFMLLAALPGLPRARVAQLASVIALSVGALVFAGVQAAGYAEFDRATRDFTRIAAEIPMAPKLLYLVFDTTGPARRGAPFLHFPAWIQAEKGGWLSFHFAKWGASPLAYRTDPSAVVPPPTPPRWEWTPTMFDVRQHGAFFDWFLVRSAEEPSRLFRADRTIVPVDHDGTWWLYRREPAK